uniref:Uncharacterized protein n=1 Tax=Equus caballus TaxID=9796 RepID=A0A9L0TG96_HORSE
MKRQLMQRKKILANYIADKGLVSKICKELIQFNEKNINNPIENGERICTRHFAKANIYEANEHMERWSISIVIREMQIETTVRYHFTPTWIAVIKNKTDNNNNTESNTCWQGYRKTATLSENGLQFLKKLNIELLYDPIIPLLGIYARELNTCVQEKMVHKCSQQHYS